ncbi:MAG TPA: DUF488 domain-containing protein [Anaerolineae bacterium]|nr:DUF488 domain-containing protein [Anaerolineae bacterium]HNU05247.1 DUF488 domain-containing protein [Anaerolineae bacterium]
MAGTHRPSGGLIRIKRAYDAVEASDGERFLVDRLWPRGVKKEALHLTGWQRDVAPSTELRQWFGHDPARWAEFQQRYQAELDQKPESWQPLLEAAVRGDVTLVYGAKDTQHNDAVVLKAYLETRLTNA